MDTRVFLSVQLALLFLIVSSPVLYSFVQSLLGRFFTVAKNGCPSTYGLLLHALVFGLVVYGLMFLGKKVESFADGGDFTEALVKAFYNSDDDSDDSKKTEAELKKKRTRLEKEVKELEKLAREDKEPKGNVGSGDAADDSVETFAEDRDKIKKDIEKARSKKQNLIKKMKGDKSKKTDNVGTGNVGTGNVGTGKKNK